MSSRIAVWWTRTRTSGALAFVAVAGPLVAQQPVANTASVQPGMRVRVWGPLGSPPVTGTAISTSASSLRIARGRDTVDVQDVTRIQEPNGRHGHALAGALVGGIAVGGTLAIAAAASCSSNCTFTTTNNASFAAVGGALGFVAGAVVGGIAGAFIRTDRWQDVPLARAASRMNLWFVPAGPRGRQGLAATMRVGIG